MVEFEEERFDIKEYWCIVYNYKGMILGLAAVATALAGLSVYTSVPIYRSTATLIIEAQQTKAVDTVDVVSVDRTQDQYYQTHFELLKSKDLAQRVIDQLRLNENPEFNGLIPDTHKSKFDTWFDWLPSTKSITDFLFGWLPKSEDADGKQVTPPSQVRGQIVANFVSRLTVTPRMKTQLVDISLDSRDPELAQQLTEALGNAFIESGLEARLDVTRKVVEWLSKRLQTLKDRLSESEKALQDYLQAERLVDLEGVLTVTTREIENNANRLADAQRARIEAESLYSKVRALGNNIYSNTEGVPEILQDAGVRDLKQREAELSRKLSELTDRYGVSHPSMVSARAELDSIHGLLRKEISGVVSGIKNRYDVARANEQAVLSTLERSKAQAQEIGRKGTRLGELKRDVESNRHLYDMFYNRFKETSEQAQLREPNIRFIDHASQPVNPIKPKKGLTIGAAIFGSLIMGILLAFARDRLDSSVKTAKDVEEKLKVPLLGIVPLYKQKKSYPTDEAKGVAWLAISEPMSPFMEAVRTVRTGLILSAMDKTENVWLVTSSIPQEGKTTLIMNLAIAMAKMDDAKVILIDADMRRPGLTKNFQLPRNTYGLSHYLSRTAELEDCIQSIPIFNGHLDVISAGLIPPNPLELLSSQAFSNLLDKLAGLYTVVLIDSPPIHSVSDAHLLAQHVRSVIYVVKADATPVAVVQEGLKHLQRFNVPLAGIVLSQVDTDKLKRDSKYYNTYYYKAPYKET